MDIIEMARALGKEIQKDERYLAMQVARQNSDADKELQEMIGDFNLKRMAINNEASKPEHDDAKIQQLNTELRASYVNIMKNKNMAAYQVAKGELDQLMERVNAIISLSAEGEDPDTADYEPHACGGDCGSCGGCH